MRDFFTIIDYKLGSSPYILDMKYRHYEYNEYFKTFLDSYYKYIIDNHLDMFDIMKKTVYISDTILMSHLIDLAFKRNYIEFFSKTNYGGYIDYSKFEKDSTEINLNIIDGCLFVVKDLNSFVSNLKR